MTHPLEKRLDDVRRRANFLRLAWGAARLVALAAVIWIVLAGADAILRSGHPAWRWIALALWVACVAIAFRRWALPALSKPLSIERIADELERRFPPLKDRLTDALAFLRDRRFAESLGSASLRRRMVAETWTEVEPLDLASSLSTRPAKIAGFLALLALGALIVGLAVPASPLRLASLRMLAPWTVAEWPRRDRLAIEPDVAAITRGGRFAIEVYDAEGAPPEQVTLQWRDDGASDMQSFDLTRRKDRFRFERSGVDGPFSFRVFGGDDDTMPWRRVEVVDPARVTSLEALVKAPPYLGGTVVREPGFVRALAGSSIDVELRLTPVPTVARLIYVADGGSSDEPGERFDLVHDAASGLWRLPSGATWTPDESGDYFFEEQDGAALSWDAEHGGEPARYRIEIVPDAAPRVVVSGLRSGEPVLPGAKLPYRAAVRDDVGLGPAVAWDIRQEGRPEVVVAVDSDWTRPTLPDGTAPPPMTTLDFDDELVLSDPKFAPGTTWEAKLVATDLADNVGASEVFRFSFVTSERMQTRIAERESRLLASLREALRLLRDASQEVREVDLSVATLQAIDPGAADRLQRAEANQRSAGARLFGEPDGAVASIDEILASIEANGLKLPDSVEALSVARATLEALRIGSFAKAEAGVRDSLGAVRRTEPALPAEMRGLLASVQTSQQASIAELEALLESLSEWDSYRRFRGEIDDLSRQQEQIADAIAPLIDKIRLGDPLDAKDRAMATQLADRQREIARRLAKATDEMEAAADALREQDALAADTLQNAVDVARERGAAGWMQEVSRSLETGDWAGADKLQNPIAEALDEISGELARRRESKLDRQAVDLREAASDARSLANEQRGDPPTDAARDAMRDRGDELRRKLERLGARQAAQAAREAQASETNAAEADAREDAEGDQQNRNDAADRLDQAADAAEAAAEQAEKLLAEEILARMRDFFDGLLVRQERLRDESQRLAGVSRPEEWTTGQLASIRALADEQDGLAAETSEFGRELESFKAFRLGLSGAAGQMERAGALARRRRLEPDAIDAQNLALERLKQLIAALDAREEAGQEEEPPPENPNEGEQGEQPPAGSREEELNRLAELRLLTSMQTEILRRTREIETVRATSAALTPEMNEEYGLLAEEQGRLAELLEEYDQEQAAEEAPADPLAPEQLLENLPE